METRHVAGLLGMSGDPSPVTGYGVYMGMKATAKARWGSDNLAGKTVAVQGCGKVGYYLCLHLKQEGARLIVTDIDPERVKQVVTETGATAVKPEEIYDQKADIFSPNALGAVINDQTLARLKAEIIAGGANNQLAEERHGVELEKKGLSYAPDYVINGGGLINVYGELQGWELERAKRKAGEIYQAILSVFGIAKRDGIPTYLAADRLAEERIAAVAQLNQIYVNKK
jgi:leucine dehydrogenase